MSRIEALWEHDSELVSSGKPFADIADCEDLIGLVAKLPNITSASQVTAGEFLFI